MFLEPRNLYFENLAVGDVERHTKVDSARDVVGFAEATGDRNPIHLSEHFAAKVPMERHPQGPAAEEHDLRLSRPVGLGWYIGAHATPCRSNNLSQRSIGSRPTAPSGHFAQ